MKTKGQQVREGKHLLKIEADLAKQAQLEKLKKGKEVSVQENFPERGRTPGQSRDKAGEIVGMSGKTLEKGLEVLARTESGDPEGMGAIKK